MSQKTVAQLKALWITGFIPTQADFADFFDSISSIVVANSIIVTLCNIDHNYDRSILCDTIEVHDYAFNGQSLVYISNLPPLKVRNLDVSSNDLISCDLSDSQTDLVNIFASVNELTYFELYSTWVLLEKLRLSNNLLTELIIPSELVALSEILVNSNTHLTSITLPDTLINLITFYAHGCALTISSVDNILSQLNASGISNADIKLHGGTNGIPTGGVQNADYIALSGRGCTVLINT